MSSPHTHIDITHEPDEAVIARRLKFVLDQSSHSIPAATADRLYAARQAAMARASSSARPRRGMGVVAVLARGLSSAVFRQSAAVFLLAALAITANDWLQADANEELVEVDSALLADDLPLDAYIDRGFGAWLEKESQ